MDPDLEVSGGWGEGRGVVLCCLVCWLSFAPVISSFLPKIRRGGEGPSSPSPRTTTVFPWGRGYSFIFWSFWFLVFLIGYGFSSRLSELGMFFEEAPFLYYR